ncbi:hypothetical protein P8452_43329 [Trifolium repens]|nr:hypothetical protein P8452_43329 [Trifolium repens]
MKKKITQEEVKEIDKQETKKMKYDEDNSPQVERERAAYLINYRYHMAKREFQEIGIKNSNDFPLIGTSLASVESLSMPLVQEVVLSAADMQCEKCQKRVIDVITKMNVETESVEVNVLEKKVTLTFRLPTVAKEITRQITPINSNHLPKVAIIKHLF